MSSGCLMNEEGELFRAGVQRTLTGRPEGVHKKHNERMASEQKRRALNAALLWMPRVFGLWCVFCGLVDAWVPGNLLSMNDAKQKSPYRVIARNRQASRNYEILERLEAGIELFGTEVKSCRDSRISLDEGFAQAKNGQLYLHGVHIAPHGSTNAFFQHEAKRTRRLLLHKKEIRQLEQATATKGLTMVPLKVYFNDSNRLKVEIALGRGKDTRDKRDDIRERDSKRELQRVVKNQSWQHKD